MSEKILGDITPMPLVMSKVEMSTSIGCLAGALAKAQSKLGSVKKAEEGYGYNYASLASTIETSNPVLSANSLAVSQVVGRNESNGDPSVTTILMHESGEYIMGTASIPRVEMKSCNIAQESGATISYLRRYALQALLNMSSEDCDASSSGFSKPKSGTSYKKKASDKETEAKKEEAPKGRRRKFKKDDESGDKI